MTDPGHHQPDYHLIVNGQDITPKVGSRLIELHLRESRGEEADQLDIILDHADHHMALPPTGAKIDLRLGWAGGQMVDKGTFTVNEVEHGGAPDRISIRARSANMGNSLRERASQSWHGATLGAIVRDIAARNGLPARIDKELDALPVEHTDQTNESDLHYLTRLARQHDAVCTVKKDQLVFLRTGSTTSASGKTFAAVHITRQSGDQHSYHMADRTAYGNVRAHWHDPNKARKRSVLSQAKGGKKKRKHVKVLKDVYASQQDATHAANSEMQRVERAASQFTLTLALAQPALMPQSPVTVQGFKSEIDGTEWLVKSVEHSLGEGGFITRLEMEERGSGAASAQVEPDQDTDGNAGVDTGGSGSVGDTP